MATTRLRYKSALAEVISWSKSSHNFIALRSIWLTRLGDRSFLDDVERIASSTLSHDVIAGVIVRLQGAKKIRDGAERDMCALCLLQTNM